MQRYRGCLRYNMSKVPLAGLTSNTFGSPTANMTSKPLAKLPTKNPFGTVSEWTPEFMDQVTVVVGEVKETINDFTRKANPNKRYWKSVVSFEANESKSRIIKMANCNIPYIKGTNYGQDYIIAKLQKVIGDAIIDAAAQKNIAATCADKRVVSKNDEWWVTINNTAGRIGIVDSTGNFDPKDLAKIFGATEEGVILNLDLVFSLRLTLDNNNEGSKSLRLPKRDFQRT